MAKLDNTYTPNNQIERVEDLSHSGIGIVHFGVGAFHRAHQAVYTHDAIVKHGGDWRILGVNLQSTETVDALNSQDGIYSLTVRGSNETHVRLIKSIKTVEAASRGTDTLFEYLAKPEVRIVSMTVTEKAYGILRDEGSVDPQHKSIAHDLANPDEPKGIIGIITKGFKLRKAQGLKPFTVLCCDNLPQNGDLVRDGIIDFAKRIADPELAKWIEEEGRFPNSMVDRITPASTKAFIEETATYLGANDLVPVETEAFSQWVIEDKFVDGCPRWSDVGVLFVDEVLPYENMKLRMLNGTHSLIAYVGFLSGHQYVRDVMSDEALIGLVKNHMAAAAQTLSPLKSVNFQDYAEQLIDRFKNPNIAHETYQIAMDGSQKMPQRIFEPALDALRLGASIKPFAYACAVWILYCSGTHEDGTTYALRDPRENELLDAHKSGEGNAQKIANTFFELPDLLPSELTGNAEWTNAVINYLAVIKENGLAASIPSST